jgi:hypothetical protein
MLTPISSGAIDTSRSIANRRAITATSTANAQESKELLKRRGSGFGAMIAANKCAHRPG